MKYLTIVLALLLMSPARAIFIDSSMLAAQGASEHEVDSEAQSDSLALFPDLSLYSLWPEFADLLIPRPSETNEVAAINPVADKKDDETDADKSVNLIPPFGLFAGDFGMRSVNFAFANRSGSPSVRSVQSSAVFTGTTAASSGGLATRSLTGLSGNSVRTTYALGPAFMTPLVGGGKSGVNTLFEQPLVAPKVSILKPSNVLLKTTKVVWVNTQLNKSNTDGCDSFAVLCGSTYQPTIVVSATSNSSEDGSAIATNTNNVDDQSGSESEGAEGEGNFVSNTPVTFNQTQNQAELLQNFVASNVASQESDNQKVPEPPTILLIMLFGLFFVVARMR